MIMKSMDEKINRKVEEVLNYQVTDDDCRPSPDFAARLMNRFDKELITQPIKTYWLRPMMRVAAVFLAITLVGNLLILLTTIQQEQIQQEVLTGYSEENVLEQEQGWVDWVATNKYYGFSEAEN
jgi:hypothetical protein